MSFVHVVKISYIALMNRQYTFPKIKTSIINPKENHFQGNISLSTYVRLNRGNKYYLVYVEQKEFIGNPDCFTGSFIMSSINNRFLDMVFRTYHLFRVPTGSQYEQMVENELLIPCDNHLSNKEQFLLNTNIL